MAKPALAQPVLDGRLQHAHAVPDAPPQVYRRRVGLVTGRAGQLTDAGTRRQGLDEDLVVEDEVIRVALERDGGEQAAAERAQAGMVLGQLLAEHDVLGQGEEPVGDVLVAGHSAGDRALGKYARAEHKVVLAVGDHRGHRRDKQRRVLVVRVHHHDDVRAKLERTPVTGLLVAPVAEVALVADGLEAEPVGQRDRLVGAGVVDEHDLVDDVAVQLRQRARQRGLGVVGGHHDSDSATVEHLGIIGTRGPV